MTGTWNRGKKATAALITAAALCVCAALGAGAAISSGRPVTVDPQKEYTFQTAALNGSNSASLLSNPDRGFRMETYMQADTGLSEFKSADVNAVEQLNKEIALYGSDQPKLVQTYFYLTGYKDKALDEIAFTNMQNYLDALRSHGMKAVLRFAYIAHDTNWKQEEPTTAQVVSHIGQLEQFITKNRDVIHVLQAGLIGAWGEWDAAARSRMNEKQILDALIAHTPDDLYLQVRYQNIKNTNVDKNSAAWNRVGYHDDFLIGNLHGWNTAGSDKNSAGWKQMTEESKHLLVDGEMIWGSANGQYVGGSINAVLIAQRMKEHHFTSLSMTHNYKEENGTFSMVDWQSEFVTPQILDQNNLTYEPSWFLDEDSNAIPRTMFDYLRDYLGYYLTVSGAAARVNNETVNVTFDMTNFGFAAPLGLNRFDVVLVDADGAIVDSQAGCSLDSLQPGDKQTITATLTKPNKDTVYSVGIVMKNLDGTAVHLANEMLFANGVNLLGDLT